MKVLTDISQQGQFHFSYSSDAVRNDSLVSLSVQHKTVKQVLDMLFANSRQYKEVSDHIIIQAIMPDLSRTYTISGYVNDRETGKRITNATVYEKQQFISTLTNDQGYFRIKLKSTDRYAAAITVSKDLYRDTTLTVHAGYDQEMDVTIKPAPPVMLAPVDIGVEKTWLGHFLLSSRQRMQSLNLSRFFADKPFQSSIVPGLGSHGRLDGQVINKFSFNLLGGYAAGLDGVEIGGIFNINKRDVLGVEAAGVFNMVGGNLTGVQLAGVYNAVLDSITGGLQAGGVLNVVKGRTRGVQLAGLYNRTRDTLQGMQAAGFLNSTKLAMEGVQLAGALNLSPGKMQGFQAAGVGNLGQDSVLGMQVAGLFNYAKTLKGMQIGIVNVADTSSGYSLGLINIIKKGGLHQLAISANETTLLNVSIKTGTKKLYGILTAGMNPIQDKKTIVFGYGLGHAFTFSDKLLLTTELTSLNVYLGDWKHLPLMVRLHPALNYRLGNICTLFAGPAVSIFAEQDTQPKAGYRSKLTNNIGWNAGISIF